MADEYLARFRHGVEMCHASPAEKLRRMPGRLLYTKLLEHSARRLGRSFRVNTKTFWNGRMTVVFPEQISVAIARYGVFEEGLTSIVMGHLKPGMTFLDVGAHFGYFSLLAAWLVGERGQVHAFEPTPSTFDILSTNLGGRPNVRLKNLAVSRAESTLTLSDYGITYAAYNTLGRGKLDEATKARLSPAPVTVRTISLDQYAAETGAKPDFVKIDAEGAELQILQGMDRVLSDVRPAVSLEVGDPQAGGESRGVLEYLSGKGYRAMEYRDGRVVPHELKDRYEYDNVLFLPPGAA